MSTEQIYVKQIQAQIEQWKHEQIELEARVERGLDTPEQTQLSKQRIAELKCQIADAEKKLEHAA